MQQLYIFLKTKNKKLSFLFINCNLSILSQHLKINSSNISAKSWHYPVKNQYFLIKVDSIYVLTMWATYVVYSHRREDKMVDW